ncbi:MAG: terminase small subunit [Lachnospiraceae bacterium]|nr:terminase small subunit [Lachnospiraceae bacterium]
MATSKGGRPPKYTSKEQIEWIIDEYFDKCDGELLNDESGEPVLDKYGAPIYVGRKPPTSAGLARALGFKSRQSLWEYKGKKEFKETIEAAILRLEEYTETRLFDKDGANGAKFSLQNNFRHWDAEKGSDDSKGPAVNIICDIPRPVPVESTKEPDNAEGQV